MNTSADHDPVNPPADPDRSAWTLLEELRDRLGTPELGFARAPERLGGGFWAQMFVLYLEPAPPGLPSTVVARITPDPDLCAWETAVQSGAAGQGFPTPAVHLSGGPDGPVGRAWTLMDVAHGQPLLSGLSGPAALMKLPRLARQLPDQLARITARLHALDPSPIRNALEDLTGHQVGVDGLLDHISFRAERSGDPRLLGATDLLARTAPAATAPVVCHGDLHPFNVLADGEHLTLLDWTAAQIADPAYDLAFTALLVGSPPLDAPPALRPVIGAAARQLARRFLARYQHHSGTPLDPERMDWFTTLHATRILCDVADWQSADAVERRHDHPWHGLAGSMGTVVDTALEG